MVLDEAGDLFAAFKLQSAWFEVHGAAGMAAMEQVMAELRADNRLVIADVKRADIGVSARAYAQAWISGKNPRADAMTLLPWFGRKSMIPFADACKEWGGGAFICARASNPDSKWPQEATYKVPEERSYLLSNNPDSEGVQQTTSVSDGQQNALWQQGKLWLQIAATAHELTPPDAGGYSAMGLVVGANHWQIAREIRSLYPELWLLAPGLGAQGASFQNVHHFVDKSGQGALFPSSRAITFPAKGNIRSAAQDYTSRLEKALGPGKAAQDYNSPMADALG